MDLLHKTTDILNSCSYTLLIGDQWNAQNIWAPHWVKVLMFIFGYSHFSIDYEVTTLHIEWFELYFNRRWTGSMCKTSGGLDWWSVLHCYQLSDMSATVQRSYTVGYIWLEVLILSSFTARISNLSFAVTNHHVKSNKLPFTAVASMFLVVISCIVHCASISVSSSSAKITEPLSRSHGIHCFH